MVSGGFVACGWVCFAVGVVRARFGWLVLWGVVVVLIDWLTAAFTLLWGWYNIVSGGWFLVFAVWVGWLLCGF